MTPNDDLRGAYKEFIDSPVGRDLLTRIVAYETQLQTQNYAPDTPSEQKLANVNRMAGLYWVRTQLNDLSRPKPTPAVRVKRTQSPSQ